jgi:hypothetical protein
MLGDVERLSQVVPHNSIDYLVDIESSIFYPDKTSFLKEVREVLRDDGVFYYGALMPSNKVKSLNSLLYRYFEVENEEDITEQVLLSLKLDTLAINTFIDKNFPISKPHPCF